VVCWCVSKGRCGDVGDRTRGVLRNSEAHAQFLVLGWDHIFALRIELGQFQDFSLRYIYTSTKTHPCSSSLLSLSKWLVGNLLCLVYLGGMALGSQWVRKFRFWERLKVRSVLLMGLNIISTARTISTPKRESRRRKMWVYVRREDHSMCTSRSAAYPH
jgi:hypothetical protein